MQLPDLRNFELTGKKVLVRVDFDVPLIEQSAERIAQREVGDETRIQNALPTIEYLLSQKSKIVILSHLGRPEGRIVQDLSLEPVVQSLRELLPQIKIKFLLKVPSDPKATTPVEENEIAVLENLRFNPGEEGNDPEFARQLASLGDFYINEAFAVSHREHASIVGLPKLLPHAAGLSLLKEIEVLSSVLEKPKKPVVVILGGAKEDKLEQLPGLLKFADHILIGGKLPLLTSSHPVIQSSSHPKIKIASLNEEGKDITLETVEKFSQIIKTAGTVVWSGPMGQYEESNWELGTKELGEAVVNSKAFTVIGGGDTEAALTKFDLVQKINFVSSGGGAMLEFLARGDLPGLVALRE